MKTLLLNWLWSSSACLLGAWGLVVVWRKKSAAWRHLGWGLGFVAVLAVLALMVTSWRVEIPLLAAVEKVSPAEVQVEAVTVSDNVAPVLGSPSAVFRRVDWWLVVWLSGVAVCLSPLMVGVWRVRRLLAREVADDDTLNEMAATLNGGRRATLLFSDAALVPLTVGIFAPKIVLPSSASAWPAERLRRVVAHELAHQQRGDLMWALLAQVVCALCWFNPLAWFAAHRQRLESERACDDCVINSGAAATDYADDLLQILKDCPRDVLSPLVMTMARHSQIKPRLQSLLAADVQRGAVRRGVALALTVSVLLVVAALTVVRVSHAAGDADGDKAAAPSGSVVVDVSNKQVVIGAKFFRVAKDSAALQSAAFKDAWEKGNSEGIFNALPDAKLVTELNFIRSFGGTAKFQSAGKMRYPAEWDGTSNNPKMTFVWEEATAVEATPEWKDNSIHLKLILEAVRFDGFSTNEEVINNAENVAHVPTFSVVATAASANLLDGQSAGFWLPTKADGDVKSGVVLTVRLMDKPNVVELLEKTIIPQVEFTDADIQDVLEYLQEQSKAQDPQKMGVMFVFKAEPSHEEGDERPWTGKRTLTLSLSDVPLKKLLDFLQELTDYKYKVEEHAVFVYPKIEMMEVMLVKTFTVPENFLTATVTGTDKIVDVKDELTLKGVEFLSGASAAYLPKTKKMVVRNTLEQLEKIEALLKNSEPPKPDAPKLDVKKKLESIIIPEGKLADADLGDVAKFLRVKSREFDPEKVGVNFLIQKPADAEAAPMRKVTVNFKNYSLKQIVEQIPAWFSWQYKIEDYAVFFVPGTELEAGAER